MKLRKLAQFQTAKPDLSNPKLQEIHQAAMSVKQEATEILDSFRSLDNSQVDRQKLEDKVLIKKAPSDPELQVSRGLPNGTISGKLEAKGQGLKLEATSKNWGHYQYRLPADQLLRAESQVDLSVQIKDDKSVWQSTTTTRPTNLAPTERYSLKVVESSDGTLTVFGGEEFVKNWSGSAPPS